jgi:hypothetical protein
MRHLLLAACALALAGCGLMDSDLRANEARSEFITTLAAVRTKLGSMRATRRTGFNARVDSSGTFVELEYETEFENGTGTEEFTWEISNGRARLLSYNVSSRALLR